MRRLALALLTVTAAPVAAQDPAADRLRDAPPTVVAALDSLLTQAAARGLPGEPLIQKAIEGTAKAAPPDRVIAALGALLGRLGVAAGALRTGGLRAPDAAMIEAGAFALTAGLDSGTVSALAHEGSAARAVDVTLRVSGTLAALGVPSKQVLELVSQALSSGVTPQALLALPAQVQAAMAHGASPAAAAAGVARGQARGRAAEGPPRGPPPRRGSNRP